MTPSPTHAPSRHPSPISRWRHLWLDRDDARRWVGRAGLQRLAAQVRASELSHEGELRVCVEGGLGWAGVWGHLPARQRAIELFSHLRVWDTQHHHGVLIYLLLAERRIEVVVDRGIEARVPAHEWTQLAQHLSQALKQGEVEAGLRAAIDHVGQLLRAHFPSPTPDARQDPGAPPRPNELPDAVVLL